MGLSLHGSCSKAVIQVNYPGILTASTESGPILAVAPAPYSGHESSRNTVIAYIVG
jgi:hypothetical protein